MAVKEFVQKLKETVDIVDVIGEQVALKRSGSRYKGLSPFSQEKTPSFFVNPETQNYHCFSTNNGGDVIDFVMETKGMSFMEAVRWLADRAGMDVPKGALGKPSTPEDREEKEAQKLALKVNKFAAHFFQTQFRGPAGARAREYAAERGLDEKTLKNFAIGYAPDSWNALRDYLISIKAPISVAVSLGLLKAKNEETPRADGANLYDIFRNRLIFPIRDGNGEVVGFGGRTLDTGDKVKYLNSPESAVFAKGQMFFNYDRARKHIRDTETAIIVEGYMDCIALDQAGLGNVVATLGTALTPTHVQILRKMCRQVVNLYDSDAAGQAASLRNMDLFLKESGFPLAGVILPQGKDPDDFLKARPDTGAKELQELIHNAPALIDSWVDEMISAAPKTVQGRADCLKNIAEKLAFLADPIWIKARIPGLSDRLMLDSKLVLEAILHARKERGVGNSPAKTIPEPSPRKSPAAPQKAENNARKSATTWAGFEAHFLRYLLLYPERLRELRGLHQANDQVILPLIEHEAVSKIVGFLLRPLDEQSGETDARRLSGLVEALDLRQEAALKNFISKAMAESAGQLAPAASLPEALRKLRNEVQEKRTQELKARIKQAEAGGDLAQVEELQRELHAAIHSFRTNSMETMNG